jgi:hypothetical protein
MAVRAAAGTAITFVEPQDRLDDPATSAEAEIPASPQVLSVDEAIWQLDPLQREDAASALAKDTAVQQAAPENVAEAVVHWLACYGQSPSEAARNIRELAAKAPEQVVDTALRLYHTGGCGDGARLLASLLCGDSRTVAKLCDPGASLDGSVRVAKALIQHEPLFDVLFAKSLLHDDQMTEDARQRGLAVLEKLGSSGRLIPILIQFLRDPDSRIRSKTALMFGQIMSTQGVMDRLFADEDARVRANFVEGLWRGPEGFDSRALFRQAVADSNHRVAGNALVGLHRLGETREVIAHVSKMARRPEALFRAAVAWAMGQTGDKRYTGVLRSMVRDPDPRVRLNALRSLRRINLASSANAATESNPTGGAQADSPSPDTPAALE